MSFKQLGSDEMTNNSYFLLLDPRQNMESSAGMSDQMSSCNSDYAPSSNSGSSGNYTDD